MQNVISFRKEVKTITPDDLMSFKEFATKHSCSLKFLYRLKNIKRYKRGIYKISENEVLQVLDRF